MTDTLQYGYRNFRETVALQWGRHFRINKNFKMILGRNEEENISLLRYVHQDDYIMQLKNEHGPTLILKGYNPDTEILSLAAGLIQRFSKYKNKEPQRIKYWNVKDKNTIQYVTAQILNDKQINTMSI